MACASSVFSTVKSAAREAVLDATLSDHLLQWQFAGFHQVTEAHASGVSGPKRKAPPQMGIAEVTGGVSRAGLHSGQHEADLLVHLAHQGQRLKTSPGQKHRGHVARWGLEKQGGDRIEVGHVGSWVQHDMQREARKQPHGVFGKGVALAGWGGGAGAVKNGYSRL